MTLPDGTVSFLFTDIEGSTRLVAQVGDTAYGDLLATERMLVLDAATGAGGVPFGSEGDAHFVAFGSASAAIRGAVAAQRAVAAHAWPAGPVRVRMGIHSGEAQVVGDDYVGIEVHRAARVAAAAHGGQLLVTDATRMLATGLSDEVSLRDLGEYRLKDLARPERLYQVTADGLDQHFPPLRTLDLTPNNLPPQLTSFVGRRELAATAELLRRTRLLTLTGPGGTGKTRLSLALAAECLERFPGGAWFVPLASITDPGLVPSAIAAAVGALAPGRAPIDGVIEELRDRTALLVLDNFEQVVAGATVVSDLLRAAPGLSVIASSRAPLRVSGEQEFAVPPLALPPRGATDLETLMDSEAVRLFVERAMAIRPGFTLTADNAGHVADVVARLDGLPLAIELAAARIRVLTPAAMAQRLGDRLDLPGAGTRDLPERQRTLRGAIAWSHDLLDPEDRILFARLAVFAGGGPLAIAEAVCPLAGDDPALDVMGGIERLAEQSLVRVADDDLGTTRFTMLETIRAFGLEQLAGRGELGRLRDAHARAMVDFAGAVAGERPGADDRGRWLDRFEEEHDNIRAALDHLVATGDRDSAAELVFRTWRFWQMRGHLAEGRSRADAALGMAGWASDPTIARLRALEAAGGLAYWAGDMTAASEHYEAAVADARKLGDEREVANALYNSFFASRPVRRTEDWIDSIASGDPDRLREAIAIWSRLGDDAGLGRGLWGLAEHHAYRGETVETEVAATRALEVFERLGDRFWMAWAYFTRGFGRVVGRRLPEAAADIAAAMRDFRANRDVSGMVLTMTAMASLLLLAERPVDAYAVGAASRRAIAETGMHLATLWPADTFPAPDADPLDPTLRAAVAEGAAWSREAAVDRTLELADALAAAAR